MTLSPREYCDHCISKLPDDSLEPHWILSCHCHENVGESFEWCWDNTWTGEQLFRLSENDLTITFHPIASWGTSIVRGTKKMKSGLHYWEVKALSPLYGTDIMVGVGRTSVNLNTYNHEFRSALGIDSDTWGLSYRGALMHNGQTSSLGTCAFRRGSIIGCLLDLWHGRLYFFIDGKFESKAHFCNLPRDSYYPMVCSTALRSGFRLIRAKSYPITLQFMICRNLYHCCACLTEIHIPLGLKKLLSTSLPYSLFLNSKPKGVTLDLSTKPNVPPDDSSDPFLWITFDDSASNSLNDEDFNFYDIEPDSPVESNHYFENTLITNFNLSTNENPEINVESNNQKFEYVCGVNYVMNEHASQKRRYQAAMSASSVLDRLFAMAAKNSRSMQTVPIAQSNNDDSVGDESHSNDIGKNNNTYLQDQGNNDDSTSYDNALVQMQGNKTYHHFLWGEFTEINHSEQNNKTNVDDWPKSTSRQRRSELVSCFDNESYLDDANSLPTTRINNFSRTSPLRAPFGLGNESGSGADPTTSPTNFLWRSRSQPPFGDAGNMSIHRGGINFLNTESSQQMTTIGSTNNNYALRASQSTIGTGLSNSTRSVRLGSSNRSSIIGFNRSYLPRRTSRTHRSMHNRDSVASILSSSSSNSSLIGRYRTISGASTQTQPPESHVPHLVRFASLRLDNSNRDDVESGVGHGSLGGSTVDVDEFAELPRRLVCEPLSCDHLSHSISSPGEEEIRTSRNSAASSNTDPHERNSGEEAVADEITISTNAEINHNVQSNSSGFPSGGSVASNESANIIIPLSPQVTMRFPRRQESEQENIQNVSDPHSNSHQPEADYDFYSSSSYSSSNPKLIFRCRDQIEKSFHKLNDLRRDGLFCDVILKTGSIQIPAHRNILAASSQYFHAMFTGPMTESRSPCVHFKGIDESALTQLINFIYTNEIIINEETVQTLLPAANLLQLTNVRDACCEFLQSQLHPSNCLGIQRFADLHNCQDLLDYSRRFTEQHFGELLQQDEEFLSLSTEQLVQLISSDRLAVSEDQLFEAVLKWIAYDPSKRQLEAHNLCSRVRFALLPRDYLVRLSQSDNFLTSNSWCKDYLIEALSYHLLPWDQKLRMASERTKPRTPIGLPKVLLVIGGQAPKAIRSVEFFEFRGGSWVSPDSVMPCNSSSSSTIPVRSPSNISNPNSVLVNSQPPSSNNITKFTVIDLPSRRCRSGVAVIGGFVYVIGGFNGTLRVRSVEVYDTVRNTWHSGPNMEYRRATLGVTVLNGLIYAVGGFDGSTGLNSAEVFDVWSGSWRLIPPMTCQRSSVGVGALNGKLYAVGGYDGTLRRCLSSVECYDPVSSTWTVIAEMTCRRSGPAVCDLNNRLYAVGGHDGPIVQNTAEYYSVETSSWIRIADLNVKRRNAGLVAYNGCLYVIGGEDGENNLASMEKYDPTTNIWILIPNQLRIGRSYTAVALIERNM